ncbi:MAG: hypothetical protein WBP18_05200 [Paracoccaceae bacterium]
MTERARLAKAEIDPAAVYASHKDVLADHRVTTGDKPTILRRWEYNARRIERPMGERSAEQADVLRRQIMLAIDGLVIIDMQKKSCPQSPANGAIRQFFATRPATDLLARPRVGK